jgi:hypothetical protein
VEIDRSITCRSFLCPLCPTLTGMITFPLRLVTCLTTPAQKGEQLWRSQTGVSQDLPNKASRSFKFGAAASADCKSLCHTCSSLRPAQCRAPVLVFHSFISLIIHLHDLQPFVLLRTTRYFGFSLRVSVHSSSNSFPTLLHQHERINHHLRFMHIIIKQWLLFHSIAQ